MRHQLSSTEFTLENQAIESPKEKEAEKIYGVYMYNFVLSYIHSHPGLYVAKGHMLDTPEITCLGFLS